MHIFACFDACDNVRQQRAEMREIREQALRNIEAEEAEQAEQATLRSGITSAQQLRADLDTYVMASMMSHGECAICMENLYKDPIGREGDTKETPTNVEPTVRRLACGHDFHAECVQHIGFARRDRDDVFAPRVRHRRHRLVSSRFWTPRLWQSFGTKESKRTRL